MARHAAYWIQTVCQSTYSDLRQGLPYIGITAILMHSIFFYKTQTASESDSVYLRGIAIAFLLAPTLAPTIERTRLGTYLPVLVVASFFICGPFFFTSAFLLELNSNSGDPMLLMRIQYEYFASVCLVLLAISNVTFGLVGALFFTALSALTSSLFIRIDLSHAAQTLASMASFWIILILLVTYNSRKNALERVAKTGALISVGQNIAHELRTPLATISLLANSLERHHQTLIFGYNESLKRQLVEKEINDYQLSKLSKAISTISQEVRHANTIIDMLLLSSKPDSSLVRSNDSIQAFECADEAVQRFPYNNDVERSSIIVLRQWDFKIVGLSVEVTHVLFNLIKNALWHAQKNGSAKIKLEVGAEEKRIITITDTGPGIPQSQIKKIFDRFYTTETYGQGTGIGLSFCKSTMEALGGSIECESIEGEYTRFTLKFP